jgi:polyisoprenoid-binding protein YceI
VKLDGDQRPRLVRGAKGTIEYVPGEPTSVKADVVIEAKTINTRNQRRDDHLRSNDFFNAEKFPSLTLKSKRVENVRPGGFDLVDDLTIATSPRKWC